MHRFHPAESHRVLEKDQMDREGTALQHLGGSSRLGVTLSFPGTGPVGSSPGRRSLQVESIG